MFPDRLKAFHRERFKAHEGGRALTTGSNILVRTLRECNERQIQALTLLFCCVPSSGKTTAGLLPELALIPPGEFVMGSADSHDDERPAHRVRLDEFLISARPITNAEYARFVREANHRQPAIHELPLVVAAGGRERERIFRETGEAYAWPDDEPPADRLLHPVTLVRWDDAAAYCAWLSSETGRAVRLPTEAEWEKAARGGVDGRRYPWGDRIDRNLANFLTDPALKSSRGTTACGSYPPNGYGLYDMTGNVWEWVQDWYSPHYYSSSPVDNPPGPPSGQMRLVRGGSWLVADVRMLACAYRHKIPPDTYSYGIGFRVVCPVA
jgi:formylglycine-generating enzyme required for sulfatase activity